MEEASRKKEEGTKEFIRGDHLAAAELYMNAAKLAIHLHPDHSDDKAGLYVKCWGIAALRLSRKSLGTMSCTVATRSLNNSQTSSKQTSRWCIDKDWQTCKLTIEKMPRLI